MIDSKKKPVLLEINPRISGSISASIKAGYNLIDDLVSMYFKKPILKKTCHKNIKILRKKRYN